VAKFLHTSCAKVLFYFILLQMGELLNSIKRGKRFNHAYRSHA